MRLNRRDFLKAGSAGSVTVLTLAYTPYSAWMRDKPAPQDEDQQPLLCILEDYRGHEVRYVYVRAADWTGPTPPVEVHVPVTGPVIAAGPSWNAAEPLRDTGQAQFHITGRVDTRDLSPTQQQVVAVYRQYNGPSLPK